MVDLHRELNKLKNDLVKANRTINSLKIQIEQLESQNRELRAKQTSATPEDGKRQEELSYISRKEKAAKDSQLATLIREVDELKVTDLARKRELTELRNELNTALKQVDTYKSQIVHYELNLDRLKAKNVALHEKLDALSSMEKAEEVARPKESFSKGSLGQYMIQEGEGQDISRLTAELEAASSKIELLENQLGKAINESTTRVNDLQNQIQGYEGFVEELKYQYQEFLEITKLEHESFKSMYYSEYERLKKEFEKHKQAQFEDKKRAAREYQTILYGMQTQFEEYRATMTYLLLCEKEKFKRQFQSFQAQFEQEIKYVVQTKDKFYDEMLVAKDAKVMQLIEGSDLRSLIVKHQQEMEEKDRNNGKILEKMKREQETEQKKTINILQKENEQLELKSEKLLLQTEHLQGKIKEQLDLVNYKNQLLDEKEEQRWKEEQAFNKELATTLATVEQLTMEKEHLRHKIVRMHLDAKGEGDNSLGSVLKRLANDSKSLNSKISEQVDDSNNLHKENEMLSKQLAEKKKTITQLKKTLSLRTNEYSKLTKTFETFLKGRMKAANLTEKDIRHGEQRSNFRQDYSTSAQIFPVIPKVKATKIEEMHERVDEQQRLKKMVSSGMNYLEKFKMLSQAFKKGVFAVPAAGVNTRYVDDQNNPLTQSISLYSRLSEVQEEFLKLRHESIKNPLESENGIAVQKLYGEQPKESSTKLYDYCTTTKQEEVTKVEVSGKSVMNKPTTKGSILP
eukprot:Nk52_evm72s914 gene=Nk52_evmTU72s914